MKKYMALHYKAQRDLLAYFLLKRKILNKKQIAQIWGVTPMAVSLQLPDKG